MISEIITKTQHFVGDYAFDTIEEAKSFLSSENHPLKKLIDFFNHQGQAGGVNNTYCDGDWFIYESKDYPELDNRPIMVVSNIYIENDLVSIDFIVLKTDPKDSYDMIEDRIETLAFSTDTVIKIEVIKHDRYYSTIKISHDLGDKIHIQEFTYEDAGE